MPSKRAAAVSRAPPAPPPSRASSQRASKLPLLLQRRKRAQPSPHARRHRMQLVRSLLPPLRLPPYQSLGAPLPSLKPALALQLQVSGSSSPRTLVAPASHSSRTQPHIVASPKRTTSSPRHRSTPRQRSNFARAEHRATHRVTQLTLTLCRQVAACSLRACRRSHACKSHRRPAQATSTLRFCR
jgi:hypothetical protein